MLSSLKSLRIMLRILKALLMREVITRYGRNNLGFLWVFLEPALFTSSITLIWKYFRMSDTSNFPIAAFSFIGYSSSQLWRDVISQSFNAIRSNQGLLYHSIVKPIDLVLSRFILEFLSVTGGTIIVGICFFCIGWITMPYDWSYLLWGWFLMSWFGLNMGLIFCVMSVFSEVIQHFLSPFLFIFWMLSGCIYAAEWLPPSIIEYALYLPTLNNAEMLRYGLLGPIMYYHYSISYSVIFNLVASCISLFLMKIFDKKIEVE